MVPPYNLIVPADRSLANNFVAACKQFVSRLHAAGVVHGDLYISIFAWRLCAGVMEVEVFDWDIAFFIHKHIPQKLAETWRHTKKWSGRYDRLRVVPGPVDVGGVTAWSTHHRRRRARKKRTRGVSWGQRAGGQRLLSVRESGGSPYVTVRATSSLRIEFNGPSLANTKWTRPAIHVV